jgi:hypothetical protein
VKGADAQDFVLGYSQPEQSKLARKWRSGRCKLLNAWKRTWTREIELVAVAVVPSIHLGILGGGWTARRELLGGRAHSRSPFDFAQGRLSATLPRHAGAGGMTKLRVVAHLGTVGGGWTELEKGFFGQGGFSAVPPELTSKPAGSHSDSVAT